LGLNAWSTAQGLTVFNKLNNKIKFLNTFEIKQILFKKKT